MKKLFCSLIFLLMTGNVQASALPELAYPISDKYIATIIGTPKEFAADLPEKINLKALSFKVFKEKISPDVFWYQDKFQYSIARQKQKAPLVFIIPGIGKAYNSSKAKLLQKAFFQAGFHVIALSSPTHPNFMITASSIGVAGYLPEDAKNVYRVMELAWQQVKDSVDVSKFYLTGFGLGGTHAAFVSRLDKKRQVFDFRKVLMINPFVSFYSSAEILDKLLKQNLKNPEEVHQVFEALTRKFSEKYHLMESVDFNDDFLYKIYKEKRPKNEDLSSIIGMGFRLTLSHMIFTSDIMTHAGYIVPENKMLSRYDSLENYFKTACQTSFFEYFERFFFPYVKGQHPNLSRREFIENLSLESINSYLKQNSKIGVVTNADDFVLTAQELEYLRQIFGQRAKIWPKGGHGGNLAHQANINYIIQFFKN